MKFNERLYYVIIGQCMAIGFGGIGYSLGFFPPGDWSVLTASAVYVGLSMAAYHYDGEIKSYLGVL